MNFAKLIESVSQDKRLKPDLMRAENGNNFRAISESAILDVIDPALRENNVFYEVFVHDYKLEVKESYGKVGKKLQFIATVMLKLEFTHIKEDGTREFIAKTDSVGMGIDDNDKAMGKAYTYAVKYALLKLFRLRYGDDPDYEASFPLVTEPRAKEKEQNKEDNPKNCKKSAKSGTKNTETPMSEAQRDYIFGLMKKHKVSDQQVNDEFNVDIRNDEFIPMVVARKIIKWFEEEGFLPF